MSRPSRHTPAEKAAIIAAARTQLREGAKRKDIAQRLGINIASLSGWLREQTLDQLYPQVPNQGRTQ
jgi:transposase-like protein